MSAVWSTPWLGSMCNVVEETLDALHDLDADEELEHYASHLRRAFEASPPPFTEEWYETKLRTHAKDPRWIASTLLSSAAIEGDAARDLWELSASTHNEQIAEEIRVQAIDASRHARMYVFLLRSLFPRLVTKEMRVKVNALSPGYGPDDYPTALLPKPSARILDELVQINLGAIRTRQNLIILGPALRNLCPQQLRAGFNVVVDRLRIDATRHAHATAKLIEAASRGGKAMLAGDLFLQRTNELNEITRKEIGVAPVASSQQTRMAG